MKEVFISYSSIDTAPAETVRNILESNGISCWMAPRDIAGGSNYTREIPIAIRNCKIFLLILSENAQNSPWVLKELDSAVNGAKVILPFMLEECILNDEFNFLLSGAQRYSAYQKKAETMEKLISRIQAILSADGEKPAQEIPPEPAPEVTPPPAPTPAPVADIFGQIVCPACGSADVKELPKKIKRQGTFEWLMLAVPVLFAILGSLVASIPMDFFIGTPAMVDCCWYGFYALPPAVAAATCWSAGSSAATGCATARPLPATAAIAATSGSMTSGHWINKHERF